MEVSREDLNGVLTERSTSPKVLNFFGTRLDNQELLQAIIQNPSTEDQTIHHMIPRLNTDLLEVVVINQTRLLRHVPIIEALENHQNLSPDQRRRLAELRHDFKIGEKIGPAVAVAPSPADVLVDWNEGPPEDEAPPPLNVEEAIEQYTDDGEHAALSEDEKARRISAFKRLVGMTPAERMMEALKGDRETRMILIRDRNRVVYSAVLTSPKLTDADIESFATLRSVSPEVLRQIGAKREWTRKYNICRELVKNPLTPIEVSMRHIARLSAVDLKRLTRDRNVPEQIRRQATKLTRSSG